MRKVISIIVCSVLVLQTSICAATVESVNKCSSNNPYHILVNKQNPLLQSYKASHMVMPNVKFANPGNIEKNYMEYGAAKALEKMFAQAKVEGIELSAVSGYRSYSRQSQLYKNAIWTYGIYQNGTAKPGESEHQTGLAMDINSITQSFAYTKEGIWLAENAHKFGFIIRYPKGKEHITGYIYEPWHVRYVGVELATYCYTHNLALEEVENCCSYEKQVHIGWGKDKVGQIYNVIQQPEAMYIRAKDLVGILGGYTTYEKGKLTLHLSKARLEMQEGKVNVRLNDVASVISSPVMNVNQSMYVPIRSTLDKLGYNINYIGNTIQIMA